MSLLVSPETGMCLPSPYDIQYNAESLEYGRFAGDKKDAEPKS